ncbi:AAA family ATPase [Silvimonas sp.]|uniref:AAA family ATPase n=1 Tax=Silvimonas sp. TaxID=2650811 RepID=UPI0028457667|nr:AAA family ATPase [Silvimonas sp.]MDR3426109.1 AAA family ATPase [Silvimonas sp.]
MRAITSLDFENFRGFVGTHSLDLNADMVVISGKNGVGKTSILLAIDLLLNGHTSLVERLGPLISNGHSSGNIRSSGSLTGEISLQSPPTKIIYADLLERAHFFFADGLDSPESAADVTAILEPSSGAWDTVKDALEGAQAWLAHERNSIIPAKFDIQSSRVQAIQHFVQPVSRLAEMKPEWFGSDFELQYYSSPERIASTGWMQSISHLNHQLSSIIPRKNKSYINPADVLDDIADITNYLKEITPVDFPEEHSIQIRKLTALERKLAELPPDSEIIWARAPNRLGRREDGVINIPMQEEDDSKWVVMLSTLADSLNSLGKERAGLESQSEFIERRSESLLETLEVVHEHGENWASILNESFGENADCRALRDWLTYGVRNAEQFINVAQQAIRNLNDKIIKNADKVGALAVKEAALQSELACGKLMRELRGNSLISCEGRVADIRNDVRRAKEQLGSYFSRSDEILKELDSLAGASKNWASVERQIDREELRRKQQLNTAAKEKAISDGERVLKQALSSEGIFSVSNMIDRSQFGKLLETLNQLLARFHFPSEFLPIRLSHAGRRGKTKRTYKFQSRNGLEYSGLSTGQKTQLSICWSVCLSYALRNNLKARVIGFDDFTTALDMGQLIPAAGILRQLAYSNSLEHQRQVIVTSHHEDMTNKLIDYLLPPPGKSMKVINIDEWTVANGPTFKTYNSRMALDNREIGEAELGNWLKAQLHGRLS